MNCHECRHKESLPYSAHIKCAHPVLTNGIALLATLSVHASGEFKPFGIVGDPHGIRHGWFSWPIDYDPVWLKSCNQFQRKAVINDETKTTAQ